LFGAVDFGVTKAESTPTSVPIVPRKSNAHVYNQTDVGTLNIYKHPKACLKDIAAHFDEADIYESKKISLLQQMEHAKSRKVAHHIRTKLASLETWHQMMQKKFLASATEARDQKRRMEHLFDAHLPAELKQKLAANKVAKRAAQKIPFPGAHEEAIKYLKSKRTEIMRDERLHALGHKVMHRPTIDNPKFPSRDIISSHLREKLYRNVNTENHWSTDSGDLERAENVVRKAHKAHGDFVEGPIAAPLLKGKLYHPETEKLGVPNFLHYFPWPKKPASHVTMDDKVRVEQTDHTTY